MKKLLSLFVIASISVFAVFAQNTELDNVTESIAFPVDTGRLLLREVSINTFEDPTQWTVHMPVDMGHVKVQRILGSPKNKIPLRLNEQINNYIPNDRYVLGIRVSFYRRSLTTIAVKSTNEIFLPGVVKTLSVWVSGRGKEHELSVSIRDMKSQIKTLPIGKLNFIGWKKLEIVIPGNISQEDVDNPTLHGLYFIGFLIDSNFEESVGRYYVYFDDLRIVSDVIDEVIKQTSEDDIGDGW